MTETPETTPTAQEKEEKTLKREAYSAATSRLRDDFREEFNALVKAEMKARGIAWTPKPTEAEKAAKQVEELLAAHPELKAKFTDA